MTLYTLTEEFQRLNALSESGEFDQEAIEAALQELTEQLDTKADGYYKWMKSLQSNSMAYKAEIDRLKALQSKYDSLYQTADKTLLKALQIANKTIVETSIGNIKLKSNPPAVIVDDLNKIPEKYLRIKYDPDKTELSKALKSGEVIEGCHLEQKQSLKYE